MHIPERSRQVARWSALLVGGIAGAVMLGWTAGIAPFVRVLPGFAPTQFNAAIGLAGCALGLHSLARRRPALLATGATLAALMGGLTLAQYVFHVDLGLDHLVYRGGAITVAPPAVPGRMAASTAMLLLLTGTTLAAWPFFRPQAFGEMVIGTIGTITGAIAGITFLSYVTGLLAVLRFGAITGMGIPTAVAFVVIGFAFVRLAWAREGTMPGFPEWLAPAAGLAALATTAIIWRALGAEQAAAARDGMLAEARVARRLVEARLLGHERFLARIARWTASSPGLGPEEWSATFARVFPDEPDLTSGAWLDSSAAVHARAFGREPGADYSRMIFLLRGDSARAAPTAPVRLLLDGGEGGRPLRLVLAAPACGERGRCAGHVVATVDPESLLRGALEVYTPGFSARVTVGEQVIFRSDTGAQPAGWRAVDTLRVGGQLWSVTTWPQAAQRQLYHSDLPQVVGVLGLLMSLLVAATLRFAQSRFDTARQLERERLEQALASSTDGMWEYDFRTSETLMGASMLRRLGYEPHAITPRALTAVWTELTHPDDRARMQKAWEDHVAGRAEAFNAELRLRAQDGEWHVIVSRGRLVERGPQGEPVRMVGVVADVSERRKADAALVESEQRFRAIFDSAFQFEMLLDREGRCLEVNRTFLDEAGLTRTEVQGRPLGEIWWPGDMERQHRLGVAVARAAAGETVQYEEEVTAGGRRLVMDFSVKPVYDAAGQVTQLLAEGRDVTERRRAQDALREMDTLSTMGRLAARVAHEINNPLAGVQNSFLLIKDAIPATHPYFQYVGAIEREIARIASITRQLYETYRPESDGVRDASVGTVVADSVAMLQQVNRHAKATVEVDTSGAPGVVRVPAGILRQAVYNLVQNAIEASPPGGRVRVKAWKENGSFHLTVADQGTGVPAEARRRIFDPFFSTKSRLSTGGMGLGLALVHRSVTGLGGTVEVTDAPDGGALFAVTLPVREPAPA
jgi:PAS domain S-box-containing protein